MRAIKIENKNGTFRFELENGDVIVKSTKRNYNAFVCTYIDYIRMKDNKSITNELFKVSSTTKGIEAAKELAFKSGYKMENYFVVTV